MVGEKLGNFIFLDIDLQLVVDNMVRGISLEVGEL